MQDKDWEWSAPRLLVDSFAIELYLKCIYVFDALLPYTKTAIREQFDRIVQDDPLLQHHSELLKLDVIDPQFADITNFDHSLDIAKDTFKKGRYLFEHELPANWFYAEFLLKAIRTVANMIVPLAVSVENQKNPT